MNLKNIFRLLNNILILNMKVMYLNLVNMKSFQISCCLAYRCWIWWIILEHKIWFISFFFFFVLLFLFSFCFNFFISIKNNVFTYYFFSFDIYFYSKERMSHWCQNYSLFTIDSKSKNCLSCCLKFFSISITRNI